MDYCIALPFFAVILAFVSCTTAVTWDQQDIQLNQGDDVSIMCTLAELPMFSVARIKLTKDNGEEIIISDNDELKPIVANTGRYELSTVDQDEGFIITLKYTGIRGEDSGTLSCFNLENPDDKAVASIYVKVPLKSVSMQELIGQTQRDITSGKTLQMKEGQTMGVICVATIDGSTTAPVMKLTLEGQDITDQFERKETPMVVNSESTLAKEGTQVSYSYITAHPDRSFNQKQLHCTANTEDGDSEDAYLFLDIYYAPVLSCKTAEYHSQLNKSITISCDLRSNPGAVLEYVYSGQDGEALLSEHEGHEQYRMEEKPLSEDHTQIHINIHKVQESHFGRYFIRATNDYGVGRTEFLLHRGATEVDIEPVIPDIMTPPKVVSSTTKPAKRSQTSTTLHPKDINKNQNVPKEPLASTNAGHVMKNSDISFYAITLGFIISLTTYWHRL